MVETKICSLFQIGSIAFQNSFSKYFKEIKSSKKMHKRFKNQKIIKRFSKLFQRYQICKKLPNTQTKINFLLKKSKKKIEIEIPITFVAFEDPLFSHPFYQFTFVLHFLFSSFSLFLELRKLSLLTFFLLFTLIAIAPTPQLTFLFLLTKVS